MYLLIYSFLLACVSSEPESRLVKIESGAVRGYKDLKEGVFIFHNIPYARAPTGPNRFKAPLPPPIWLEPLEAVNEKGIICPQHDSIGLMPKDKIMQEDCLIANVYAPDTDEKNLPVLVIVHGGGFVLGYGDLVTPKKIVSTKKVIAVTFNYRLGAHGFLCLGTEDIPGNAGMKDQVALLKWVKKNIAKFGGNPKDVTISGYSAGSSSVDLLMLSKMAKGLFNKVIPESGANIAAFAVQVEPLLYAQEYAKLLNFTNTDDFYALEDFFKSATIDVLQSGDVLFRTQSTFLLSPCVERDIGEERFLEDSPLNILKSGKYEKLPMLYGFANMEGLLRIQLFEQWKDTMNINFAEFLPTDLKFKNDEEKEIVADKIKNFYFGDKPVGEDNIIDYVNFFSDILFTYSTLKSTKLQLKAGNKEIYLYEYSFVDDDTPIVPYTKVRGANHCAQTHAIYDGFNLTKTTEDDISDSLKKMKSLMRETWLNFIKTGKPEASGLPSWPPVKSDWSPHMALNLEPELRGSLLRDRILFWDEIYDKYYHAPSPPPTPPPRHSEL